METWKIILIDFLASFIVSDSARCGNIDAFRYKKSKSRIKKDKEQLSKIQRIFWVYNQELTHVPKFNKLFYTVRIFEVVYSIIIILIALLNKTLNIPNLVLIFVLIRQIVINIPFVLFGFYCSFFYAKDKKGWGFYSTKKK